MGFVGAFLNGWGIAVVFGGAIALWAVRAHLRYKKQFQSLKQYVSEAAGLLSSVPDPSDFHHRASTVSRSLEINPVIGQRWKEYRATWLAARSDKPLRSPRAPDEFFNEDLYRSGDIDVRAYEALPNQFVGVGLCLTFVGLIISLYISQGVITATPDRATVELSNLLQAASFKFLTSLVALTASVVFIFAKNRRLFEVEKAIAAFCAEAERLVPVVSPEELAEENNEQLERQGEQLAEANRTLAVGIADALEDKLKNAMLHATQPLVETMRNMTERLSDINRSALEHMADRFSQTLSGAAAQHTDRMASLFKEAADALGEAPTGIREAARAGGEEIRKGAQTVERALASWTGKMNEASLIAAETLQTRATEHAEFVANAMRQESAALLEGIASVADDLASMPALIADAGQSFAQSLDEASTKAAEKIGGAADVVTARFNETAEHMAISTAAAESLNDKLSTVAERIAAISDSLNKQVASIFSGAEAITDRLAAVSSDAIAAKEAAEGLNKMGERVQSVAQELGSAVEKLHGLSELQGGVARESQQLIVQLEQRSNAMDGQLSGLSDTLANAFKVAGEGFASLGDRTAAHMAQLDSGFARGLGLFNNSIQDLEKTIDRLADINGSPAPRFLVAEGLGDPSPE